MPRTLFSHMVCGHHIDHGIMGFAMKEHMSSIRKLYSIGSLASMGATYMRVLSALPFVVNSMVVMRKGIRRRSARENCFVSECFHHFCCFT